MNRTPSPPRRLHTPPAPFHGDYEPYSPRRSTRVAAQRDAHPHSHSHRETIGKPSTIGCARRDVTPTASSARKAAARTSNNFALSPPSSPITSPQHHQISSPHRSPRKMTRATQAPLDAAPAAPTPARRLFVSQVQGMLPTPEETPRKRPLETKTSLKKTARILFPERHATIEDATPRKARKTKNFFSLEDAQEGVEQSTSKIPIFTDSKERVPEKDNEEDNPFVITKGKGKSKAVPQKSKQLQEPHTEEMNAATNRDEGLVYIFRGRKVFRKFDDVDKLAEPTIAETDPEMAAYEKQLRHQAGPAAHRPLTRSTVKPRLLFEAEIKERRRLNGEESDDEEADTEIEVEVATPSRSKGKAAVPALEATPPPTVRKVKREVSFHSWSRVKSAHYSGGSSPGGKKRAGETLERDADKRARSEHSTSSMSLDSSF